MGKEKEKTKKTLTRTEIDKADITDKSKEANLLHQEILLGISEAQSDAIFNKLYNDGKAQRPN